VQLKLKADQGVVMKIFSGKDVQRKQQRYKNNRLDWLLYLPGALIISYGLWLSVTNQIGN
jgi:hypothetical protein